MYSINWKNVNLKDNYTREQNILDPYNFETLLLELNCNIPTEKLTEGAILKQANEVIASRAREAREIILDNVKNVLEYELKQRES